MPIIDSIDGLLIILNQILNCGSLQAVQASTGRGIVAKMRGLDEDGYPHLATSSLTYNASLMICE